MLKKSFYKSIKSLNRCFRPCATIVICVWLWASWVVVTWLQRIGFSIATDASFQGLRLASRNLIFLFHYEVVVLWFCSFDICCQKWIALPERQSIVCRYVSTSFNFSVTLLARCIIPRFKRIRRSFRFALIVIFSSIYIPYIPKIVGSSISHESFRSWLDRGSYLVFCVESLTWPLYSIGKSFLVSDSFNILNEQKVTSMAILSLINLGSSAGIYSTWGDWYWGSRGLVCLCVVNLLILVRVPEILHEIPSISSTSNM